MKKVYLIWIASLIVSVYSHAAIECTVSNRIGSEVKTIKTKFDSPKKVDRVQEIHKASIDIPFNVTVSFGMLPIIEITTPDGAHSVETEWVTYPRSWWMPDEVLQHFGYDVRAITDEEALKEARSGPLRNMISLRLKTTSTTKLNASNVVMANCEIVE